MSGAGALATWPAARPTSSAHDDLVCHLSFGGIGGSEGPLHRKTHYGERAILLQAISCLIQMLRAISVGSAHTTLQAITVFTRS